ncbi:MAG: mycofactocin oligosaccharide methyltransferase MftM [Gordonia sp. (in: high G+C Gram-positive bacteria)]|uniref:mycofactocin oligosaccharide methyltransferase MftM n=1 Tax=Gordonia sp. (in: high G+C Gram-positive bacteria) TaxID=84139 RepID=UPI003C76CB5E
MSTASTLTRPLSTAELSDSRVVSELTSMVEQGIIVGQEEFESAFVDIVTAAGPDRMQSWRHFYANSIRELRAGTSAFSPIHHRARSLLTGTSVLEVGCCFGLFALQCAQDGYQVTASDICPGALDHLDDASSYLGLPVKTALGDVRQLPFATNSFDTVTLLHLLEHLDNADVEAAIVESCRVASKRVIIAVPFEDQISPHFGHLELLRESDLHRWSAFAGDHCSRVFADHGGWLVIDVA